MEKILLLNDEARRSKHLLQNAVPTRPPIGEIETVAARNCDRWGHPCPGCVRARCCSTETGPSDFNTRRRNEVTYGIPDCI